MNSKTVQSATAVLPIYDCRYCIGFVLPRGKVKPSTAMMHSKGLFPAQQDAIAALSTIGDAA